MPISRDSLRGYLLEELLTYLIRNTGYRLLVDPSQDPEDLEVKGNGLVVRGRGAFHQADVLGQLPWVPAFTYPLRLFVEAKCRKARSDISQVRNAVGVIEDLNQNYSPVRENRGVAAPRQRYCYCLFSTSGFSEPASDMALAHQISLVDLSGSDFDALREALDELADAILTDADKLVADDEDEEE